MMASMQSPGNSKGRAGRTGLPTRLGGVALLGAALLAVGLSSCRSCSRREETPRLGPAPVSEGIPQGISIPVEVDGKPAAPIDSSTLARVAPDYEDGDRRAWRIGRFLGPEYARPDAVLEVLDSEGLRVEFVHPSTPLEGREPVLVLNRRGEMLVAMMKPEDPFPAFHGRGGNRRREGDPVRRIRGIRLLRLFEQPGRP